MTKRARLPIIKDLRIPRDAIFDEVSLRILLREIRLTRRESRDAVAQRLKRTRYTVEHWEYHETPCDLPGWVKKDWARALGYRLRVLQDSNSSSYKLEPLTPK